MVNWVVLTGDLNSNGNKAANGRAAVFVDLDRTLIGGSSAFHFGRVAYRAGLMSRKQLINDAIENVRFRYRGSTDAGTDALLERLGSLLGGMSESTMNRLMPGVLAGVLPRTYPQMLAVAYEHQDAGRPIYICTAASHALAELLSAILAFDGALGTRPEVIDGQFTGKITGTFMYREGKAKVVREFATQEGINLEHSWAYTDSESDLPLLRAVGNPVAVNPDKILEQVARDEGWEILRFDQVRSRVGIAAALMAAAVGGGLGSIAMNRRSGIRRMTQAELQRRKKRLSPSGRE